MPIGNTETIIAWKSKRLSDESIKSHATSGKSLGLKLKWIHNSRIVVERIGSRSKQDKATQLNHRNVANWFLIYELET